MLAALLYLQPAGAPRSSFSIASEYRRRSPAASIAWPLTRRVMASMSQSSASGRQPLLARYQQPDQAAPSMVSQKSAASSGVLPIARPKRRVFVAAGELNQPAAAEAIAVSARRVAVAIDAGVDIVGEVARIACSRAPRPAVLETAPARPGWRARANNRGPRRSRSAPAPPRPEIVPSPPPCAGRSRSRSGRRRRSSAGTQTVAFASGQTVAHRGRQRLSAFGLRSWRRGFAPNARRQRRGRSAGPTAGGGAFACVGFAPGMTTDIAFSMKSAPM